MERAVTSYFVDGCHGRIKGHMPLGSWADVIQPSSRVNLSLQYVLATLRYSGIRCNPDQFIGCDPSFG
ncbi:hypothetical protein [Paenibacillus sp. VMFN-D1]|uniref:hypothetical protein n=1 Tax=Paenibacillus sp. VMFN-D1 TaxID=2135608 RepID=UPI000E24F0FE|nr:hypothetical protein [Paenibacillus sp. VMFN-D1]RED39781.1 hypothetical protein C7820_0919 [Paenibacillus sp. VMFN-D1]